MQSAGVTVCVVESGSTSPLQQTQINECVQRQYNHSENNLRAACQPLGVQHGNDVMVDESPGIACLAPRIPQVILERRERADPPEELDENTPRCRGQVHPRELRPAQDEETAQNHEQK